MKFLLLGLLTSWASLSMAMDCPDPWVCKELPLRIPYTIVLPTSPFTLIPVVRYTSERIRAGYFPEQGNLKGNIIYYQGLGDSMLNHHELFNKLSLAGYRIIAFDYMGQGGSTGTMNRTRIEYIPWIAKKVWNQFADVTLNPDITILAWSTGGLAAYMEAAKGNVKKVILIAPGNTANFDVGEGLNHWPLNEITMRTLTTDQYGEGNPDPHVDPIRPNSPVSVPAFSLNLIATSLVSKITKIPDHVEGFVLLSGAHDTYVDGPYAEKVFAKKASHFQRRTYPEALHEIHNEEKSIREKVHRDILEFLETGFVPSENESFKN